MKHLFMLALTLLMAVPVGAQDDVLTPEIFCTEEGLTGFVDDLEGALIDIQGAIDTGDLELALSLFRGVSVALSKASYFCYDLDFSSEEHGQLAVIGPVLIPPGVYRVTATTEGYLFVQPEILSGECSRGSIFNLTEGQAVEGAQAVFRSSGCEVLLETSNTLEPWRLTFERVVQRNQ